MERNIEFIKITLNGNDLEVQEGLTVIQACDFAGVDVPRFCYHDRLKIAGNCRMCLVEIQGFGNKLSASCSVNVRDGMIINTDTEKVISARSSVMKLLLANHPLDCPICDQGGECDLQDQSVIYGLANSDFKENKRSVSNKNLTPIIKTEMNRCIHCTRCVRFMSDVAGKEELIAEGRGESMEINTYDGNVLTSEISGNIIDICPVGALTSNTYSLSYRSWELLFKDTIDVSDAVGSNIRVEYKGSEIVRVLPRLNENVNEEWISDKTRFSCDGLLKQRIDSPYVRGSDGKFSRENLSYSLDLVASIIKKSKKVTFVVGNLLDTESIYQIKKISDRLNKNIESEVCRQDFIDFSGFPNYSYLFNTTISSIEISDLCIFIGVFPRLEAPIINSRIRKRFLSGCIEIFNIGSNLNHNYTVNNIGNKISIINDIINYKHDLSYRLEKSKNPMIILGYDVLNSGKSKIILSLCFSLCIKFGIIREDWNGFNFLQRSASSVAAIELGCKHLSNDVGDTVYLVGADEIDLSLFSNAKNIIYQGHHGDLGVSVADVVLPGSAWTEKDGIYVNTEGRVQYSYSCVKSPGEQDWFLFQELGNRLFKDYNNYESIEDLRQDLFRDYPVMSCDIISYKLNLNEFNFEKEFDFSIIGDIDIYFKTFNFYMTDSICRSSKNMSSCSKYILPYVKYS